MATSKQANKHRCIHTLASFPGHSQILSHSLSNAVPLVWGLLRLAPIMLLTLLSLCLSLGAAAEAGYFEYPSLPELYMEMLKETVNSQV